MHGTHAQHTQLHNAETIDCSSDYTLLVCVVCGGGTSQVPGTSAPRHEQEHEPRRVRVFGVSSVHISKTASIPGTFQVVTFNY